MTEAIVTKTPRKELEAAIVELKDKVTKLETSLKSTETSLKYKEQALEQAKNELEAVHQFFDALPGVVPRKTEHEDSWQRKDISAITRLSVYLANRSA